MKKLILFSILLIVPISLFAQPPGSQFDRMRKPPRRQQIEMLRIWKMTEELDLTEQQAEKFFPKLRNEDKKIEELEQQRQKIFRNLHEDVKKGEIDAKELDKTINDLTEIQTDIIQKHARFIRDMDGILSTDQQARLIIFRHRFRERMVDMMRDVQRNRMNKGKMRRR
ncbi:MAG: hypothetical protein IIB39_02290 [Candidatus Marinimicrobia bacterium]|nr:hypothetical protein [Candidatus Neomarinimicrobiota bacterium]